MITSAFRISAFASETSDVWVTLLEITHDIIPIPFRYAANVVEDIVSDGDTYIAAPFQVSLPDDTDERPAQARIRLARISHDVIVAIRTIDTPATVTLKVVLATDPNTKEVEYSNMLLTNISADDTSITGTLGYANLQEELFPAIRFGPTNFPGLFS